MQPETFILILTLTAIACIVVGAVLLSRARWYRSGYCSGYERGLKEADRL